MQLSLSISNFSNTAFITCNVCVCPCDGGGGGGGIEGEELKYVLSNMVTHSWFNRDPIVMKPFLELVKTEVPAPIIIHDAKCPVGETGMLMWRGGGGGGGGCQPPSALKFKNSYCRLALTI